SDAEPVRLLGRDSDRSENGETGRSRAPIGEWRCRRLLTPWNFEPRWRAEGTPIFGVGEQLNDQLDEERRMKVMTGKQNAIRQLGQSLLLGSLLFAAISASAQTEKKTDEQTQDSQEKPLPRIETIEANIPMRAFD